MLGVYDEAKSASSVSTKDASGNVIIFIDDTLTESKQTFALAHEIGHIVLEHSPQIPKAVQENEANKFAHYLLNMKSSKPHWNLINIIPLIALLCACLFILYDIVYSAPLDNNPVTEPVNNVSSNYSQLSTPSYLYSEASSTPSTPSTHISSEISSQKSSAESVINSTYYWTEFGYVYHSYDDCQSLHNSPIIFEGTLSEALQEKERLCKFCEKRN